MGVTLATLPTDGQRLLDLLVSALQARGVDLPLDPDGNVVAYCSPGSEFAWHGASLVVCLGPIAWGTPNAPGGHLLPSAVLSSGSFLVWLVRKAAVVQTTMTPPAAALNADFATTAADMQGLSQAIFDIYESYSFTDMGDAFILRECIPLGPDGGLMAVKATIEVQLT